MRHVLTAVPSAADFADQAHYSRMFTAADGITLARYTALRTCDEPA
jgi:hypothetical protein